jgi:hypothetical protein
VNAASSSGTATARNATRYSRPLSGRCTEPLR